MQFFLQHGDNFFSSTSEVTAGGWGWGGANYYPSVYDFF